MGEEGDGAAGNREGSSSDEIRQSHSRRTGRDVVAHATTLQSGPGREPAPELAAGTLLNDTYRVEECIGRGAMGAVYLVTHTGLAKKFAAKVVSGKLAMEPAAFLRLRNEARAASAIDHENIVNVTDLGQTGGMLFVIMELLRGVDLRARLEAQLDAANEGHAWLSDELARDIVDQVLSALEAAHAAGIVHRDLKPENIFLATRTTGVRAKIVDFGISKILQTDSDLRLTATGQIIGTPLYMAPEQTRSTSDVDHRADIYSMGMIAYEIVTGSVPFTASNIFEIVLKHATEIPRSPKALRADLPEPVVQVILRCLEKNPNDRFQSAGELREAWAQAWEGVMPKIAAPKKEAVDSRESIPILPTKRTPLWPIVGIGVIALAGVAYVAWPRSQPVVRAPIQRVVEREERAPTPSAQPAPPVTPTETTVHHTVESDPAHATILRDGREIGTTPLAIELRPGEQVRIEIAKRGYRTEQQTVSASDPATISIALHRAHTEHVKLAPR